MSNKQQIIINKDDHKRLESLFLSRFATAFGDKPYLQSLRGELNVATIIEPDETPQDVITMESIVRLREVPSKRSCTYTLVYPEDASIAEGKLSVLAPIGTAILGYRVGDLVRVQAPSGLIQLRIEELIFQPERDGVSG